MLGANAPGAAYFGEAYDAPVTWSLAVGGMLGLVGRAGVGRMLVIDTVHAGLHAGVAVISGPVAAVATTGGVRVG